MTDPDFEVARCARRAIEVIVRHAGRPGARAERRAVAGELVRLLSGDALAVRRHALWMLSEIGDDEAVPAMAHLLLDPDAREDARCALDRIPGPRATEALRTAFAASPEDFKYALAHSLRLRGERVEGYPSPKIGADQEDLGDDVSRADLGDVPATGRHDSKRTGRPLRVARRRRKTADCPPINRSFP